MKPNNVSLKSAVDLMVISRREDEKIALTPLGGNWLFGDQNHFHKFKIGCLDAETTIKVKHGILPLMEKACLIPIAGSLQPHSFDFLYKTQGMNRLHDR